MNNKPSNSIKCENCRNIFESPVILPCGDSICKKHTTITNPSDSILSPNKKLKTEYWQESILCHKCSIEHIIPANGFPANNELAEMVNTHMAYLDLFSNEHKNAKQSCEKLDEILINIEQLLNDPLYFIYEPIDYLINLIQLKGEEMIMEINEKMHRLISKLDECKSECKKDLSEKEYGIKSENFRNDNEMCRKRLEKWLGILDEINVNEQDWKQIKIESEEAIKSYENKLDDFKMELFPKRFEEFQVEIEKDFGKFEIDPAHNLWLWRNRRITEFESTIVVDWSLKEKLVKLCGFEEIKHFKLLYRGSLHGFGAYKFHEKCDSISKTFVIIKAAESGNIFGGYTEAMWNHVIYEWRFKEDNKAFLFSLVNKEKTPVKVNIMNERAKWAIAAYRNSGPAFGTKLKGVHDYDIFIADYSNTSYASYSNFGCSYKLVEYPRGSEAAKNFLAGSYNFKVEEIEVFQL